MAAKELVQVGDIVNVQFEHVETHDKHGIIINSEPTYISEITKIDAEGIHFSPKIRGQHLAINTHRYDHGSKLHNLEHEKHFVSFHPKLEIRHREIRQELIDYTRIHDEDGEIREYRISGIGDTREENKRESIDGVEEGLIINAKSQLGAIIAYMDWLDGRSSVKFKELMWDQVCHGERYTYISDSKGVYQPVAIDIEDYIKVFVPKWLINSYIVNSENSPEISFPQTPTE